jgi:hypothetical protein
LYYLTNSFVINILLPFTTQTYILDCFYDDYSAFDESSSTVGTHTLRKTGYMFAVFGIQYRYESTGRRRTDVTQGNLKIQPLEDDALGKSARHKTLAHASVYMQNCLNKWESSGFHSDLWCDNKVSAWKPIYYGAGNNVRRNDDPHSRTNLTLPELAGWYIETVLGFAADYSWRDALAKADNHTSNKTAFQMMREFFSHHLKDDKKLEAEVLLQGCFRVDAGLAATQDDGLDDDDGGGKRAAVDETAVEKAVDKTAINDDDETDEENKVEEEVDAGNKRKAEEDEAKQKKRQRNLRRETQRKGDDPISLDVVRKEVTVLAGDGTSKEDILKKIGEIIVQHAPLRKGVVPKDWEWLKKLKASYKGIQTCIKECHGGDGDKFFAMDGSLALQKYKCRCKSGEHP